MEGKVDGIWTLEFRLIRDVLAVLLKPEVPVIYKKNYKLQSPLMSLLTLMQLQSLCKLLKCIICCRGLTGLRGGRWMYKHTSLGCARCNSTILTGSSRRGA